MTNNQTATRRDLKAVETLINSRGWAILKETMQRETDIIMQKMASSPDMTTDQTHYYRGVLFSALQLQGVPERLKTQLETEFLLHKDDLTDES